MKIITVSVRNVALVFGGFAVIGFAGGEYNPPPALALVCSLFYGWYAGKLLPIVSVRVV